MMCAPWWSIPPPILTTFRQQHRTFQFLDQTGSDSKNACYDVCTMVGIPRPILKPRLILSRIGVSYVNVKFTSS